MSKSSIAAPNRVNGRLTVRRPDRGSVVAKEGLLVAKERVGFAVEVDDEEIEVAVAVDVGQRHAHARLRLAVQIDRAAHRQRRVLEAPPPRFIHR